MLRFLKNLFGQEPDLMERMAQNELRREAVGAGIAEDCFENGLRAGKIYRLSQISEHIHSTYGLHAHTVESGFMARMKMYLESEDVIGMRDDSEDMVFVHKDHLNDMLNK